MADTQADIAQYQTDHDLLVTLNERMRGFGNDIKTLTEAARTKNEDHEIRLRVLEKTTGDMQASTRTWRFVFTSAFSVVGVVLTIISLILSQR